MKKLVAAGVVIAVMIVAAVLAVRTSPQADTTPHPQLDALLQQCDAGGSSLATMYRAVSDPARRLETTDPARVLAMVRGQIANVIDGRIAVCERALAIAQHDKRGSDVMAVGPFLERLRRAHDALGQLVAALEAGSDAPAKLTALDAAMQ